MDNVDQSALGDNVIESSTEDPGLAEETGAADESADGDISEVGGTVTGDGSDSSEEITEGLRFFKFRFRIIAKEICIQLGYICDLFGRILLNSMC